jgi:hypothetical protein
LGGISSTRLQRAASYRLVPFGTVGHELRRHHDILKESDANPQPLRRALVNCAHQYLAVERTEDQQPACGSLISFACKHRDKPGDEGLQNCERVHGRYGPRIRVAQAYRGQDPRELGADVHRSIGLVNEAVAELGAASPVR